MAHVQGASLKVIAVVLVRLMNSPTTSAAAMDRPYSLWADGLSKFQSSSEAIQAL
jgi:hypothetical protein